MKEIKKVLFIRFSSIGDIVLTTPVLRSFRKKFPNAEIHFATKNSFVPLLEGLNSVDKIHVYHGNLSDLVRELKKENFDLVVDLHRSIRSKVLRLRLRIKSLVVRKYRLMEWKYMYLGKGKPSPKHTVERYFDTVKDLGCVEDKQGLDFFIPSNIASEAESNVKSKFNVKPIAIVLGGGKNTKKWIPEYFITLINKLGLPVIFLGGEKEKKEAEIILKGISVPFLDLISKSNLKESAAYLQQCQFVITHDTGLMHISAALGLKIFSLWGNTVPEFGFAPYHADNVVLEVGGLSCRPCSKIGYDKCPKGHFNCMNQLKPEFVERMIRESTVISNNAEGDM